MNTHINILKVIILVVINIAIIYILPNLLRKVPIRFTGTFYQVKDRVVISTMLSIIGVLGILNTYLVSKGYVQYYDALASIAFTSLIVCYKYINDFNYYKVNHGGIKN